MGIWPVRLNRNCGEAFLLNQPFRNLGPRVIKVVRSVRGFPQQDET